MAEFGPKIRIDYGGENFLIEPQILGQYGTDYCGEPQNDIYCVMNDTSSIFAVEPRKGVKWDKEGLRRAILADHPFYHVDDQTLESFASGGEIFFQVSNGESENPDIILNHDHPEETIPVWELSQILVNNAIHDPRYTSDTQEQPQYLNPPATIVPANEKPNNNINNPGMVEIPISVACVTTLAVFAGFMILVRRAIPAANKPERREKGPDQKPAQPAQKIQPEKLTEAKPKPQEKSSDEPQPIVLNQGESLRIRNMIKNIPEGLPQQHAIDQIAKSRK